MSVLVTEWDMSWRHREDVAHLRNRFAVIQSVGKHAEGEDLNALNGFLTSFAVREGPWDIGDFRQPAAIMFLFYFDSQRHGQFLKVTRSRPAQVERQRIILIPVVRQLRQDAAGVARREESRRT